MKIMVMGLCLVCLCGCSTVSEMTARLNAESESSRAQKEKADYVPVVYPAELRQYGHEQQDPVNSSP